MSPTTTGGPQAVAEPTVTATFVLDVETLRVAGVEAIETGPYQNMRFSPNGKMALVTKQYTPYLLVREESVSVEGGSEPLPMGTQTGLRDLWLLDLLSGQERQLATGIGRYSWSPDSSQVAYIAPIEAEGIAGALYVLDIAGGEARQVAPVDFLGSDYTPQWLPTGEIVYVRDGLLWATTAEGDQEKALPFTFYSWVAVEAGKDVNQTDPAALIGFRFSPGGERVAYLTRSDHYRAIAKQLWLADANGAKAQLVTKQAEGSYYEWSPNEEWLLFNTFRDVNDPTVDQRDPGLNGLWVVKSDGSDIHRLHKTEGWRWILSPIWSPDSKMIMFIQAERFTKEDSNHNRDLRIVKATGGATTLPLTNYTNAKGVIRRIWWSPDGKYIFTSKDDGTHAYHTSDRLTLTTR